MCKIFRCTPSQLMLEDAKEIEQMAYIYGVIGEKNPFMLM